MDLATAVVTLAVGALAVLPRVPALTADGRAQARIQGDLDVWVKMPPGDARERLGVEIERQTTRLLEERARDKTLWNGWLAGTAWMAGAWVLLVASTAVSGSQAWVANIHTALQGGGVLAAAMGALLLLVTGLLASWRQGVRAYAWLRRRHRETPATYEI